MQEVGKRTKGRKQVIIQKTEVCNLGSVRYKDELIVDNNLNPYVLSEGFKNAVMKLPDQYNNGGARKAYLRFIERWGTVCHNYM